MDMDMDDDRYATQRGRYLARITDLRLPEAKTVAYGERGYSHSGIAKKLDTTESTIEAYMERAMARYGLEIMETLLPDQDPPDYEVVEPGYHRSLDSKSREIWFEYVLRHEGNFPQDWVNGIKEEALSDGLSIFQPEAES